MIFALGDARCSDCSHLPAAAESIRYRDAQTAVEMKCVAPIAKKINKFRAIFRAGRDTAIGRSPGRPIISAL
jgi:hypothetical protein